MSNIFVPHEFFLPPGMLIASRFVDIGLVLTQVQKIEGTVLHTIAPYSGIVMPLDQWKLAMYQKNIIISPN